MPTIDLLFFDKLTLGTKVAYLIQRVVTQSGSQYLKGQSNAQSLTLIVLTMSLSSCGIQMPNWGLANNNSDPQYSVDQNAAANSVVEVQKSVERLPVKVVEIPTITGVGFSAVSIQPGKNLNQKRIMAIKAARLDALGSSPNRSTASSLLELQKLPKRLYKATHYEPISKV